MTTDRASILKRLGAAALAAIAAAGPAFCAGDAAGTSAAQFLKMGAGGRAAAMAEAHAAMADDVYAAYYNPAGLALLDKPSMGAMHAQYIQGVRYQYGAVALPLGQEPGRTVGFSVANLGVSDMERRTQDTDLPIGYFEASNFAYALSYGWQATDRLAAGVSAKSVRVTIDEISGSALAVDAGLRYRAGPYAGIPVYGALAVRNFGSRLKLGAGEDPIPSAVVLGFSAAPSPGLLVALDFIRYRDTDTIAALGGEYRRRLSGKLDGLLRGGYSSHRKDLEGESGLTLGAGLAVSGLAFDFAWVPFGDLGSTFRYSLQIKF